MEVTKWLKPSESASRIGDGASVQAVTRVNAEQAVRPDAAWQGIHAFRERALASYGARRFFCECLGWKLVGENQSYPASFVSDGNGIVTLWQVEDSEKCVLFDRRRNVGLHHLALKVVDCDALDALHGRVAAWPDTVIEFAPERSGKGPKVHFMVREPGGTRIEFACVSAASG